MFRGLWKTQWICAVVATLNQILAAWKQTSIGPLGCTCCKLRARSSFQRTQRQFSANLFSFLPLWPGPLEVGSHQQWDFRLESINFQRVQLLHADLCCRPTVNHPDMTRGSTVILRNWEPMLGLWLPSVTLVMMADGQADGGVTDPYSKTSVLNGPMDLWWESPYKPRKTDILKRKGRWTSNQWT